MGKIDFQHQISLSKIVQIFLIFFRMNIGVGEHFLLTKIDVHFNRGLSSHCSSFRGLRSTIQLRIDSSLPAQACPWKFHNIAHANCSHVVPKPEEQFAVIMSKDMCDISF
jgi:hypothetical protein